MTYMDIFTDAVSYFTDIPQEFIKTYIKKYIQSNSEQSVLLEEILNIDFPEVEGLILLSDLKSGDLKSTINFFNNSLNIIRKEENRMAMVN